MALDSNITGQEVQCLSQGRRLATQLARTAITHSCHTLRHPHSWPTQLAHTAGPHS
jgi:hypothetical protein